MNAWYSIWKMELQPITYTSDTPYLEKQAEYWVAIHQNHTATLIRFSFKIVMKVCHRRLCSLEFYDIRI